MKDKICPVCNQTIKSKMKTSDGVVCLKCFQLSPVINTTVKQLQILNSIISPRVAVFRQTRVIKSILSSTVFVDDTNKLFYIDNKKLQRQRIYSFNEVTGYEYKTVGGETVSKKKHGVAHAVAGTLIAGPVGGVIGAIAAPTTTKTVGTSSQFYLNLNVGGIDFHCFLPSPPQGFSAFLDDCISDSQNRSETQSTTPSANAADELLKYKQLLDCGAISQDEYDKIKKQILGL